MTIESIYPEYIEPEPDESITIEEESKLAAKLIEGWESGSIPNWENLMDRAVYVLKNVTGITTARKKKIASRLWQVENIDKLLFRQKRQIIHEIDTIMTTWPQPKTKTELNNAITGTYYLSKATFFTKYSNYRCQKIGSTWPEFVSTYEPPIDPS
jgi:hypothetical protein